MTCNFCGNKIDDSSEFCFICGQKVVKEEETPNNEENVFSTMETPAAEETVADAQPEAPVAPVKPEELFQPEEPLQPMAPAKPAKVKKPKPIVGKFLRFICFISTLISAITYKKAVKKGNDERKEIIINLLGKSIVWKLAVVVLVLLNKYCM